MATPILDFREPLRTILGDTHPTIKRYQVDQLDLSVKLVVQLGKAPGIEVSGTDLTPSVTPTNDEAENWAKILFHAAKRFILPAAAAWSFRTRALSQSFGDKRELVFDILSEIYALDASEGGE